ncbi:unnamed protein product [Protopolystoma xenopodis]|uniref:Uncharacterized protein n=1 Tax=Protopolystoma xenopodis TaxID=117903 RepID=A0A3S5AQ45_9PLAT|nr:unnamed protein product [Protopolystoma xenopodis]
MAISAHFFPCLSVPEGLLGASALPECDLCPVEVSGAEPEPLMLDSFSLPREPDGPRLEAANEEVVDLELRAPPRPVEAPPPRPA